MKIPLDGLNSRLEMEEDRVSELENISIEITLCEEQRDKNISKKSE